MSFECYKVWMNLFFTSMYHPLKAILRTFTGILNVTDSAHYALMYGTHGK